VGRRDGLTPRGFLAQSALLDVLARVQRSVRVAKRPNGTPQVDFLGMWEGTAEGGS
jgi:hypothetical protein